jgi:hypothetical protein
METFLGQPVTVGMTQFIIAQIVGLGVLAFDFWSFQQKDQRKYFVYTTFSSLLWITMYALVGAQIPVLLVASVSTVRNAIFWWALTQDTPKSRMIARRTMYTSLVLALVSASMAIPAAREGTRYLQVFLLLGVLSFVVGQYMPGYYPMRLTQLFYAVTLILLNTPLDTFNPMGIIIEVNKILAIVVFFVILHRKNKEKRAIASRRPVALGLAQPIVDKVALAA